MIFDIERKSTTYLTVCDCETDIETNFESMIFLVNFCVRTLKGVEKY